MFEIFYRNKTFKVGEKTCVRLLFLMASRGLAQSTADTRYYVWRETVSWVTTVSCFK